MGKWENIKNTVRTNIITDEEVLTAHQWAKKGYIKISENCGKMLWTNQYCARKSLYLFADEVRLATDEELKEFFPPKKKKTLSLEKQKELEKENKYLTQQVNSLKNTTSYLISALIDNNKLMLAEEIVIDTETTGIYPEYNELLQVSIIDTNGNTLFDSYIKPTAKSWIKAEKINHISPEMVKNSPTIEEVMPQIIPIIMYAKKIIGYNVYFDLEFLENAGCVISDETEIIDVMKIFARIYGEYSYYYEDYKFQKLITCAEYYGYDWKNDDAHNSLSDCKATLFCYNKMFDT